MVQGTLATETVGERLSQLDERLRSLQDTSARDATSLLAGQARLEATHATLGRAVAEQATAHAVLAQWMRDWSGEVAAWRTSAERRMGESETHQEAVAREMSRAHGAMRVATWVLGTALTVVTGVFSGVMVRVLGELMARAAR